MKNWLKLGSLNTLEHGITRFSDAMISLALLWALPTETFSKLALAQAAVAPLLVFFVCPEVVFYRDYGKWKNEGSGSLARRVSALRAFDWGKAQAALLLALIAAWAYSHHGEGFSTRVWALIWAFSLVLSPQVCGADREFLRMELRLKELNVLSLFQKLTLLAGTLTVAFAFHGNVMGLALTAAGSLVATALLARALANRALLEMGAPRESFQSGSTSSKLEVVRESLASFSVWSHLSGVCTNWIQTMDLFFLGLLSFPARVVGLYAAALKLANFANALPLALSNFFSVWMGRRIETQEGKVAEKAQLPKLSFLLFAASTLQAIVLYLLAPYLIRWLSHGRWSGLETDLVFRWLGWILAGNVLISSTGLFSVYLSVRHDIQKYFMMVTIPWFLCALTIYPNAIGFFGPMGAAWANVSVAVAYLVVLALRLYSEYVSRPGASTGASTGSRSDDVK